MQRCSVVLIALVALVGAQHPTHPTEPPPPSCNCGAFISLDHAEYEIHRLPPFPTLDCDETKACALKCADEAKKVADEGMDFELENGYTLGQELCIGANHHGMDHVDREPVYVYSNTCDGPWIWDGVTSLEELCCQDGHYQDCDTIPPHPPQH